MKKAHTEQLRSIVIGNSAWETQTDHHHLIDDIALAVIKQKSGQPVSDRYAQRLVQRSHDANLTPRESVAMC